MLSSPLSSTTAANRGFNKPPFVGFPLTATVAQSLRPFPQFSTILTSWAPDGNTWYNSLQAKATKRYSHGLEFTALFTWAKQLTTSPANFVYNATAVGDGGAPRNDIFNHAQNKYLSAFDQPVVFTIAPSYTTPKLNVNKVASSAGVPTAGFGQISTAGIGSTTNIQTPTSRQGTVVVRFRF